MEGNILCITTKGIMKYCNNINDSKDYKMI